MKAVFIAFDLAHEEKVLEILNNMSCRGYTAFGTVQGRGSHSGEPHLGSHAWPSLATAILTMVPDEKCDNLLARLHELDKSKPKLGLRAFVWQVTDTI
ncbi:MAG: hypothetical protein K2M87_05420 [Muribaculaceae bacterium]|nr:hypothetical protein [Muribaculaceae bacterium]